MKIILKHAYYIFYLLFDAFCLPLNIWLLKIKKTLFVLKLKPTSVVIFLVSKLRLS